MFDNALFLFQIAVIVGSSWLFATVFRRFGQPRVVGEMAAGIALGPTLFGWVAPAAYQFVFPPASLGFLNALSQSGLVMFVFLVGVRVDFEELRAQSRVALTTSIVSVVVPLVMGLALAFWLYPAYATAKRRISRSSWEPRCARRHSRSSPAFSSKEICWVLRWARWRSCARGWRTSQPGSCLQLWLRW